MSYKAIMNEQTRSVFDAAIATKILQHINRVRDYSQEGQARRWIWELIQNAKDASYPEEKVKIKVELRDTELIFSHTGRPFNIKGVLSIINQVSSKLPEDEETTGKFGTGFVTTHLLSEVVRLRSVLSDIDAISGELLPAKGFEVALDRSGANQEEVLEAVNRAVTIIENIDTTESIVLNKDEYNTSFIYELKDERSKEIAKLGIEDLKYSVLYALAFVDKIEEIEIVDTLNEENKVYKISKRVKTKRDKVVHLYLSEKSNKRFIKHELLVGKKEKSMVAVPVKNGNFLVIDINTPRVFADFPLIGSEEFPVPVICNSSVFQPDEPRSFLPISESEHSINSNANKVILKECMELYRYILEEGYEEGYEEFYNVVQFRKIPSRSDLYAEWVEENISEITHGYIQNIPVITLSNGEQTVLKDEIIIPMSESEDEIQRMTTIFNMIQGRCIPKESLGWCSAFKYKINLSKEQFMELGDVVSADYELREEVRRIDYLQAVYDAVLENKSLYKEFASGNLAIVPDQTDMMNLHSTDEIFVDIGIDDNFKKSINLLNRYCITGKPHLNELLIYERLVHQEFNLRNETAVRDVSVYEYKKYIEEKTEFHHDKSRLSAPRDEISSQLLCCCPDKIWFDTASVFFPEMMEGKEYRVSEHYDYTSWRNTINYMIFKVADRISNARTLDVLAQNYYENDTPKAENALREFIIKGSEVTKKIFEYIIFPNQRGQFRTMNTLYFDHNIDEELKEIACKLISLDVEDYYDILLKKEMGNFTHSRSREMDNREVIGAISRAISTLLNNMSLSKASDNVQVACTLLLAWIENNEKIAQELIPQFCNEESRMKLLTPKSATILSRQVKEMNVFLEASGYGSLDEIAKALEELRDSKENTSTCAYENLDTYIDFSDAYYLGWSDSAKKDYALRVGEAGEVFAFELLQQKWRDKGYEEKVIDTQRVHYTNGKDTAELFFGDRGDYKQQGWDIRETFNEKVDYYEVKSSVNEWRTKTMYLSESQSRNILLMPQNYHLMSLYISRNLKDLIDSTIVSDILESQNENKLSIRHGRFEIQIY